MRARFTAVAALAAGGLIMTGCSSESAGGDGMVWSMWIGSTEDQQAWTEVANAGGEAAGVDVTLQGSPFSDYWTKLSTQLGSAAAPCIVSMQSLRINQFVDGLLPLGELIETSDLDIDAFDQGALDALAIDGEQYALPYDTGPLVLFYNRDAFTEAGIDQPEPGWTVEEFETAASALAENDRIAFHATVEDIYLQASALAYNGGRALADDGSFTLDDPAFAEAVEWLSGLVQDGVAAKANGPDGAADDNAFINGSVVSMVGGPWQLIDLNEKVGFDLGVATLPAAEDGQRTFSAGSGFGVSAGCSDPEAAFAAIAAMTSAEVLDTLAAQGRAFPARTAQQDVWYENAGVEGADAAMASALASAIPLPGSDKGDQFGQLLAQFGPQMVNGERPADEVLAEIAGQLGE